MTRISCGWLLALGAALIGGCASTLSGLGGTDSYACKAPQGVLCTSVAGVYANSLQSNLPSQLTERRPRESGGTAVPLTPTSSGFNPALNGAAIDAASIRSAPRVLRMWLAPFEDSDGDLQEASTLYVVIDSGHWLIDHQPALIRSATTPIAAPKPLAKVPADTHGSPAVTATPLPRPGAATPAGVALEAPKIDNDAAPTRR